MDPITGLFFFISLVCLFSPFVGIWLVRRMRSAREARHSADRRERADIIASASHADKG